MCTICFYVTGFLFVCNFSLVVLRISILSLDVSIDRCKENFPTNRVTRSLHVASNFAFCSVVNVFFFTTGDHFRYTICLTNGILLCNQEYSFDSENNYVEVKFSHILNIRVPRFTEKRVTSRGFLWWVEVGLDWGPKPLLILFSATFHSNGLAHVEIPSLFIH